MPDSVQPDQPAEPKVLRRFRVKLIQTVPAHEKVTEVFEHAADNKKVALKEAQNFIDDEKELEGTEYRLEAEEIKDDPSVDQVSE